MKAIKKILTAGAILLVGTFAFAQNITTASAYFKTVSEYYTTLKTYETEFDLNQGTIEMAGHLSFKAPDLLRLDFSNPPEQVFCYSSNMLTIYLPGDTAVLQQQVSSESSGASLTTPQGLNLLNRYYTVAYETGPEAEFLDEDSDEKVIKLILYKRSTAEAFKTIRLYISADTKLIRRVEATPNAGDPIVMNFYDYKLNPEITDQRFIYDAPSDANNYNNFLFSE
ncbi:MAG: outer-membrane lipoprotein carrier protein LolA [Treponema sp.]|nr:outer-membrane lipoprotein carrier protein LolA [Treponema sp.]